MMKVFLVVYLLYLALVWGLYMAYTPEDWWAALAISIGTPLAGLLGGWVAYRWMN